MNHRSIFLCMTAWLAFQTMCGAAYAAAPAYLFRTLTVENGMSSNTVRSMCQDCHGLIWLGTSEGLNTFDGKRIARYRMEPDSSNHNVDYINALFEDSEKRMWAGTDAGVYYRDPGVLALDRRKNRTPDSHDDSYDFSRLDVSTRDGVGITSIITHIAEDRDLNLWFSTRGQGLFRFNPRDKSLTQFVFSGAYNDAEFVYVDSNNTVWVAVTFGDSPLYTLNKATDTFTAARLTYFGCKPVRVQTILEDAAGDMWFGTWENGLQRCERQSRKVTPYLVSGATHGLTHIHAMIESAPGELLVSSDDGLLWYNTGTRESRLFVNDQNDATSLADKFVYPIVKDSEGGIWVGTYYRGVSYAAPNSGQFERYSMSRLIGRSEGYVVSCFCEDENGNVWVGSDNGGLICFSPRTRTSLKHYLPGQGHNSISSHNIHALCVDNDNLWVGTYAGGLNRLDMRTGVFHTYYASDSPTSLDNSSVYAVFRDRDARIWVTTMSGVHLYNRDQDNFTRVRTFGETTLDIKQTSDGDLWFATAGKGIFRYSEKTKTWRNYLSAISNCTLVCNFINSLYLSPEGELWAATDEGLCRYDAALDGFRRITLANISYISYVVGDGNYLWLATTQGLWRYSPSDGQCVRFGTSDGLVGEQFMVNSGILTSDGKIYVGSTSGFNAFFPHLIYNNRYVPPVVITEFVMQNRSQRDDSGGAASASVDFSRKVKLSHRQNDIIISYAALSYCAPEKNMYAYMLEGFDKQWRYVDNLTTASYTNLPAGHYYFRVRATNNDGIWNDAGASVDIVVHPHPLLSTLAKIIYAILLLIGAILGWRQFLRYSERQTAERFDRLYKSRDAEEFGAKIQFMTMIAHEIRTPVSLIIGPLEKIMSKPEHLPSSIEEDLRIIDRNSNRLLQLINQLLDFRNMSPQGGLALSITKCNISALLTSIVDRFRPTMEQKGIAFVYDCPDTEFTAMVDTEALTKVVSNLLSNAVKYTSDQASLTCTVDSDAQCFTIRVSDNGAGLKTSDRKRIFVPFYRVDATKPGTGIGLTIVKSIVESHHGTIAVNSTEGVGSEFVVSIPILQPGVESLGEGIVCTPERDDALSDPVADNGRFSLLIVEDDADMLDFLTSSFKDKYQVLRASNGQEALDVLKRRNVTLIISDWMMPGISGADLCRQVRDSQYLCHIPFILLTAKADFSSSLESLDCGADAHVKKPFSLEYLRAMVSHLIDLREILVQKYSAMPDMTQQSIAVNRLDEEFLVRMKELIEANISNVDFSIDMLAEKMCVSRSGLFSKVRSLQGITPNRLIQNTRLKSSARILLEGKYPVSVVSYMVGFNNPSYFSKCFVQQFGMSPHEWIDRHKPSENMDQTG